MTALASSKQKYILMSHRKLRRVANEVRGKAVPQAMQALRFMPQFSAQIILKHLHNACANLEEKYACKYKPEHMVVSTILVDEGPSYNRFKPRAQGRIYKIQVTTAHLQLEIGLKKEAPAKKQRSKKEH